MITDLTMPGMTGLEVAREIKGGHRIPLILSSGLADGIDLAKARELGFVGLLPKPYSAEELSRGVAEALKQRHSQDG